MPKGHVTVEAVVAGELSGTMTRFRRGPMDDTTLVRKRKERVSRGTYLRVAQHSKGGYPTDSGCWGYQPGNEHIVCGDRWNDASDQVGVGGEKSSPRARIWGEGDVVLLIVVLSRGGVRDEYDRPVI
jgi:hypothetical protein